MLTYEQCLKILVTAIDGDILILTVDSDVAAEMHRDILNYVCFRGWKHALSYDGYGHIDFRGGYGNIKIKSVKRWNDESKFDFKGRVYVTNRRITDIKHIVQPPAPITAIFEKTWEFSIKG